MEAIIISPLADETSLLVFIAQQAGISFQTIPHISQEVSAWDEQPPDIILLALPRNPDSAVADIHAIRARSLAPLVVIGDQITEQDQIQFYQAGADLVVMRPFSARLLVAQIQTLLRRTNQAQTFGLPMQTAGPILLDPVSHQVTVAGGEPQHLTNLEFRLLHILMTHAGHAIPNDFLVSSVWGYQGEKNRELVRGLVQRLRAKLEADAATPRFIETESGVGYRFNPEAENTSPL